MKAFLAFMFFSLAALTASAVIITRPVAYEHNGVKLEGYLAYDAARVGHGKIPGVLVIHEWWGLNDYARRRAEQLARLGYVAFALDMYGTGKTTTWAKQAGEYAGPFYGKPLMAQRAQAGLDQLLATGLVDPQRVAAVGYCFGGTTALALAFSGAPLAGVVSFHGGLFAAPADAAAKTRAKFLICHGAADPLVPAQEVADFTRSMNDAKLDYQFISYAGALHAFTNPGADTMAVANGLQGKIGYNAAADRRSWEHLRAFFTEIFAETK
jgi:dienelactone hydrolase